jgi:hypothetical protein
MEKASGWWTLFAGVLMEIKLKHAPSDGENLILWGKDMARSAGKDPDSLKLGTKDNGKLFSEYSHRRQDEIFINYSTVKWTSQYSGATQLFSTSTVHPTYEISGGYYYDKNLNQIVLVPLCITKKNDYGTGNAGDQKCTPD